MYFQIGADPELFVKKGAEYLSAYGLIPGDKQYPHPVNNGAVQVDGMALEFNIDPADTEDGFIFNIKSVMQQLMQMVPDYEVVTDPVATFSEEYLKTQPLAALMLGCDPDFNAWTGEINKKPEAVRPIRTAAGHVHIGWTEDADIQDELHLNSCRMIIKQLDFCLGLPSLLFDKDTERRELYGAAGAFRPKSYGVEYRVLSNRWLSDDRLIRWVYRATEDALLTVRDRPFYLEFGDIQHVINTSDVSEAKRIIAAAGIAVPEGV